MPASLLSPNVDNYYIGKGILSVKLEGESTYRDMGNAPQFTFEPTVEKLDHFSSRAGVKKKDKVAVISQTGTLVVLLEEFTPHNLALMLMGEVTDLGSPGGAITIDVMSNSERRGAFRFIGTNDVGAKVQVDFPLVSFTPSKAIEFISEEYSQLELTGDVLLDETSSPPSFGTVSMTVQESP